MKKREPEKLHFASPVSPNSVSNLSPPDRRLSKSMESLDKILKNLEDIKRNPSWNQWDKPRPERPKPKVNDDTARKMLLKELSIKFKASRMRSTEEDEECMKKK